MDEIRIGPMPAAFARPESAGEHEAGGPERGAPFPGIIVIHEIFGLNDDIRRIVQRFADNGYATVAPHLYFRGPKPVCILRTMRSLRAGQGEPFDDIEAARRWLVARDDVDGSRVGVAGFCMGGGFALLYAVRAPVGATAPFYGEVPRDAEGLRGVAPVCASFGARDRMFGPKAAVLERHLSALGVPHDVKSYPQAGHSFMSRASHGPVMDAVGRYGPMHAEYNEAAAEDAWARMLSFFGEHLRA
jgi:carboxymethylenebutenolidase